MPDRPFEDFFSMSSSEISHIISHQFFKQIFTNNEKGLWMAFFFLWRLKSWKFIAVSVSVYVNRRLRILEEKRIFIRIKSFFSASYSQKPAEFLAFSAISVLKRPSRQNDPHYQHEWSPNTHFNLEVWESIGEDKVRGFFISFLGFSSF